MKYKKSLLLAMVALFLTTGCLATPGSEGSDEPEPASMSIESFDRIDAVCLDDSEFGRHTETVATADGERITLDWGYRVPHKSAELRASLGESTENSSGSENQTFHLALETSGNATDCPGSVRYETVLLLQNAGAEYSVEVTVDGEVAGKIVKSGGGGGVELVAVSDEPSAENLEPESSTEDPDSSASTERSGENDA